MKRILFVMPVMTNEHLLKNFTNIRYIKITSSEAVIFNTNNCTSLDIKEDIPSILDTVKKEIKNPDVDFLVIQFNPDLLEEVLNIDWDNAIIELCLWDYDYNTLSDKVRNRKFSADSTYVSSRKNDETDKIVSVVFDRFMEYAEKSNKFFILSHNHYYKFIDFIILTARFGVYPIKNGEKVSTPSKYYDFNEKLLK